MALGGARPGAGRPKGKPNKANLEVRELARVYGPDAIAELARIAGLTKQPGSDNEGTRVAAIKELIDRGYGKATQPITGEDGGPLALMVFTGVPHAQEEH
jgi:hypothetical protein